MKHSISLTESRSPFCDENIIFFKCFVFEFISSTKNIAIPSLPKQISKTYPYQMFNFAILFVEKIDLDTAVLLEIRVTN